MPTDRQFEFPQGQPLVEREVVSISPMTRITVSAIRERARREALVLGRQAERKFEDEVVSISPMTRITMAAIIERAHREALERGRLAN